MAQSGAEGLAQPPGVGVGNKDLPVSRAADQAYQPGDTLLVQLFEEVVEQQQGRKALVLAQRLILPQLQGEEHALSLPLGACQPQGMGIQQQAQVVAVYALGAALQEPVPLPVAEQQLPEGGLLQGAVIGQADGIPAAGDGGVMAGDAGQEIV